MNKGNIGIDESNHGNFPEIYVAAFSLKPEDIKLYARAKLEKTRCAKNVKNILKRVEFKYIVIERYYKQDFGVMGTKIIVLTEFFKAFPHINTAYIDGQLIPQIKTEVTKIIGKRKTPNIVDIIKGDKKIKLINMADRIAYYLFKNHTSDSEKASEIRAQYMKNLITPNLAQYANMLITS